MSVLLFYEGVLRSWSEQPIMQGFLLAQCLAPQRLVVATSTTEARVERDLRTEGLRDAIAEIVDLTLDLPPLLLWQRQIEDVRSRGSVSMVVSPDPQVIEWVVEHGIIGLLFAHPGFGRPPHRPEQGSRSWESLLEELEART